MSSALVLCYSQAEAIRMIGYEMVGLDSQDRAISTFILTLQGIRGVGPRRVQNLLDNHKSRIEKQAILDESFAASLDGKLEYYIVEMGDDGWSDIEEKADLVLEKAQSEGISVLHPYMRDYPKRMLLNRRHPPILFCKGNVGALNRKKAAAIIGTRQPTDFGARMGRRLAEVLAEDDYLIVSGLALGSDTMAHEGALDVAGETVALLPTPIDAPVYPKSNQGLAERILDNGGALVSEYAPGSKINERQLISNLVARDEWQPAIADGVIAVETSKKGGTNHALKHALETETPIAVFDYRGKKNISFFEDERFGGNLEYLQSGKATPIFEASSIEEFKKRMDSYRDTCSAKLKAIQKQEAATRPEQASLDIFN